MDDLAEDRCVCVGIQFVQSEADEGQVRLGERMNSGRADWAWKSDDWKRQETSEGIRSTGATKERRQIYFCKRNKTVSPASLWLPCVHTDFLKSHII